jgi:hypothetical protein
MTSIEWLIEEMCKYGYAHTFKLYHRQVEEAKEMHKQQITDAYEKGEFNDGMNESSEQYYQETFVSKGSETLIDYHIVDLNETVELPQQEISNEEIEKASNFMDKTSKYFFQYGAKWYREQLKQL